MALQIPAGSIYEASGLGGVASLTLATLLKGTHTQSAREFAERLEQHGASLSLSLGAFDVTLQLEMLASEFWPVMRVLHDGVVQAGYQTTEIRKERALLLAGLESDEESPGYRAHSAFVANVYAGSPLARPLDGTQEELRRLRPRQIHRFYQSFYQPNGSILALSGDLDLGSVAQSLPALWEDWQPRHQTFQPQFDLRPQQQRYIRHLDMPEREQCTLLWGHLGVSRLHPDFMALLVLDVILGNGPGFASRIPKRLRDEQGLCYQVSLSCTLGAQAFPGVVQAQVECLPEKADACLQGILSEIQRIQNDTVSLTELQAAQAYLNGQFAFLFETNAQRCHYLLQHENYAWPQNYLKAWSENLMNIEIQDIQRVAQQHLNTQNWTLITAGARPNWKETNT